MKKSWHQKEHWSEEKYNIKKTPEAESFHRSRRMFVIYENQLLLADHNVPYSHAEWFEKEDWLKTDDDFFMENYVRGFMDSEGIFAYVGYDYRNSPWVEKLLTHYSILQQFVIKLDAKRETPIFAGMQKQDGGGKFKPQKYLGNVVDFLGEYQFKAREEAVVAKTPNM